MKTALKFAIASHFDTQRYVVGHQGHKSIDPVLYSNAMYCPERHMSEQANILEVAPPILRPPLWKAGGGLFLRFCYCF